MGRRRILAPCACALAFACLIAAAPAAAADGADAALARARDLLDAGRLYPAEQAAREAVALGPQRADTHRLLGQILVRRRQPELAVPELERAAALDPNAPGLARELALARFDAGDCDAARSAIRSALRSEPEDPLLHLRLGQCELELYRPDHAIPELERAARDPELREVAQAHLAVARERVSRAEAIRDARTAPGPLGEERARSNPDRPWQLGAGAGAFYESNVRQSAIDEETGNSDGAGQFELAAAYELPVWDWFDLEAGYDFYQSVYFEESDFDLQSHALRAAASRPFGESTTGSLSYLYSLNTLGGSRFLDLHELRPAIGYTPTPWWHAILTPGLRFKRFDGDRARNADTPLIGTQQLFALGSWERRLLLGIDGEFEDTDSREFDYRGFAAVADLQLPIPIEISARHPIFDLRYRFRYRDYTSEISSPTGERRDRIHSARARLDVPLITHLSLRIEYEYEDAHSDVDSADYDDHIVGGSLRFEL
jgi:tetratricopeptide (TPR) repeat protein